MSKPALTRRTLATGTKSAAPPVSGSSVRPATLPPEDLAPERASLAASVPRPAVSAAFRTPSAKAGLEDRSEEHTSELQSRQYLVCRLLLEKKNTGKYRARPPLLPQPFAQ